MGEAKRRAAAKAAGMDELHAAGQSFEAAFNLLSLEMKQATVNDVNDAFKELGLITEKNQIRTAALRRVLETEPQKLALKLYEVLDSWLATFNRDAPQELKQAVACRSGCSACCHIVPEVSRGEMQLIASYIHQRLSAEQQSVIETRTKEAAQKVREHGGNAHASWPLRCPLLADDGNCSVYRARPSTCRAWLSSDKNKCDANLAAAQTGSISPDDPGVPIPLFGAVLMFSRSIFSGYCAPWERDVKALPLALEEFFVERRSWALR
jgi:Fe-S-cluster containining protein